MRYDINLKPLKEPTAVPAKEQIATTISAFTLTPPYISVLSIAMYQIPIDDSDSVVDDIHVRVQSINSVLHGVR